MEPNRSRALPCALRFVNVTNRPPGTGKEVAPALRQRRHGEPRHFSGHDHGEGRIHPIEPVRDMARVGIGTRTAPCEQPSPTRHARASGRQRSSLTTESHYSLPFPFGPPLPRGRRMCCGETLIPSLSRVRAIFGVTFALFRAQ